MENSRRSNLGKEAESPEIIPSLIKAIDEHELADFDSSDERDDMNRRLRASAFSPPFNNPIYGFEDQNDVTKHQRILHSVSISMPPSPLQDHLPKRVLFRDEETILGSSNIPKYVSAAFNNNNVNVSPQIKPAKFYSQQIPKGSIMTDQARGISMKSPNLPPRNPRINKLKDKRYDSFKTWSGKLERQISTLRGRRYENEEEDPQSQKAPEIDKNVPVDRYFDALEGPELDTLRASEEILLPEDKQWPFLLRFPVGSFGICLGVSSQAIMWKTLATSPSTSFLHISLYINLVLWLISIALVVIVFIIYTLKTIFYFEAVRREYYHPIRVNFFFAPWIALLFLALGVPPSVTKTLHHSLWYVLMTPIVCLELKIYGQWMSGGQRRLSKVANPSNHLSVVGNFVGALLGASMGLKEGPIFFFAIGIAHYTVLFVTLYQRLPTNETLPKELHPVFFLFVAAPSVASMAWARIQGSFDYGSRIAYFIALFLYFSLAVRVNFFRGIRFSLAWWAYTFPMTGAAIATIRYADVVTNPVTKTLTVILCIIATLTVGALLVTTIIHAFVLGDLFPNDMAIAISDRRPKSSRKWFHKRSGSTDARIEHFLKYSSSEGKDIEASVSDQDCQNKELSPSVVENVESKPIS